MNPMAIDIVNHLQGDEELDLRPRRLARAAGVFGLMIAIPLGVAVLNDASRMSRLQEASGALDSVTAGRTLVLAAHAGGVANGLLIGGIRVPSDLINRIEAMVTEDIVAGTRRLAEVRIKGLEGALSGDWNLDRLIEYVSLIEGEDPGLRDIISEGADRLAATGVPMDLSRSHIRAMAVMLMTGNPDEITPPTGRSQTLSVADTLGETQARLWSHLTLTDRVGGLDTIFTRSIAIAVADRLIKEGRGPDTGDPSP